MWDARWGQSPSRAVEQSSKAVKNLKKISEGRVYMSLSEKTIKMLQDRYEDLINYTSSDPMEPIDPLTYLDSGGDHLIHIAAQRGDLNAVELLLDAGIDIDITGDMGSTALHYASWSGHVEVVGFLLRRGASTTIENYLGSCPLDWKPLP